MASRGPHKDEQLKIPKDASRADLEALITNLVETGAVSAEKVNARLDRLRTATNARIKVASAVETQISPDQERVETWLREFKTSFDALPQLHEGIQWADVEKALRADPEAMRKLQALDEKGHKMNVFGEENGEFIFASGWYEIDKVAADHRNIVFDEEAQKLLAEHYPDAKCNGNAIKIIAKIMGVKEDVAGNYLADTKFHEQLRKAMIVDGWAWLKTDAATRKTGGALDGFASGIGKVLAYYRHASGSFRAVLRVKKA
jgi:hypothetical protein